jgi:hypothetical protein
MSDYRGFGTPPLITDAWQNEPLPTPESSHPGMDDNDGYEPSGMDVFKREDA